MLVDCILDMFGCLCCKIVFSIFVFKIEVFWKLKLSNGLFFLMLLYL